MSPWWLASLAAFVNASCGNVRWVACGIALALGCGEDAAGSWNPGGLGGTGGEAGSVGAALDCPLGGEDGMGGAVLESCEGVENFARCEGPDSSLCMHQSCLLSDCAEAEDGDRCYYPEHSEIGTLYFAGVCGAGLCRNECETLDDGAVCSPFVFLPEFLPGSCAICLSQGLRSCDPVPGECLGGACLPRCRSESDCFDDPYDCRVSRCLEVGLCESVPVEEGTACGDGTGTCEGEVCESPE